MATNLLAFPFQINGAGFAVTLPDNSDDYYAQEIAIISLTHKGERELVPDFGITDPSFDALDEAEFIEQVELFGVPVDIRSIQQEYASAQRAVITVTFDTLNDLDDSTFNDTDAVEGFYTEGL